jgi:hypothetical protein
MASGGGGGGGGAGLSVAGLQFADSQFHRPGAMFGDPGYGNGGVTINVSGGISTSAEIGESVVNAIRAYNRAAGPANIAVA